MPSTPNKPSSSRQQESEWETMKCEKCSGDGFTAEHADNTDPETGEHDCCGCPVQAQCEYCHAEGKYMTLDVVRKLILEAEQRGREEVLKVAIEKIRKWGVESSEVSANIEALISDISSHFNHNKE